MADFTVSYGEATGEVSGATAPVAPAAVAPPGLAAPGARGGRLEVGDVNPRDQQAPAMPVNSAADNAPAVEPGMVQAAFHPADTSGTTPAQVAPAQPPAPGAPAQPQDSTWDVEMAAFRRNNFFGSLYDRMVNHPDSDAPAVPGYNPANDIHGYEDYLMRFTDSESPAQTRVIKDRIDAEKQADAMIARNGIKGQALVMAAGILDPITVTAMAIPGIDALVGASRLARIGAIVGTNVARIGAIVGTNVALSEAQQAAITATQETTKYTDNIGMRMSSNALLAGVLGTIATRIPKTEFDAAAGRVSDNLAGRPVVPAESTAGAMEVPQTSLEQESIAKGGQLIAKAVGWISPVTRIFANSPEVESRRLAQQLVDVPFMLKKNEENIPTADSVEMRVNQQENTRHAQLIQNFDSNYADFAQTAAKDGKPIMSRSDFGAAVVDAMRNSDQHEIPQVAAVAKFSRPIFDMDRKSLQDVGALPEDFQLIGAPSYFPRVWDQHAVMNNQTELENRLTDWYTKNPKTEVAKPGAEVPEPQEPMTTLYHGSPYVFSKFDHSKIGTGEGNQSFSHGISTSENPEVAASYARELNGKDNAEPQLYTAQIRTADLKKMLDWDKPLSEQPAVLKMLGIDKDTPTTITKEVDPSLALEGETSSARALREGAATSGAAVRKVEVPNPEWKGISPEWTGQQLHDALYKGETKFNAPVGDKPGIANWLSDRGALGMRYLDNGSRGGVEAAGSRNTVLYKNAEATITHRNGELINPDAVPQVRPSTATSPIYREPGEVKQAVRDTIDHILGTVRGTADIGTGVKNPSLLKGRALDVPDELIKPWLSSDFEHVMASYHHSVLPQIEMRKTFGSTDLTDQFEKISDSYRQKIEAAGDDDLLKAKLSKQLNNDNWDLTLMRDRVLNQTGPTGNMGLNVVRTAQIVRSFNYLRMLGGQTLSAIPDVGRLVSRYGLANTIGRTAQLLTGFTGGLAKADAQRMGTALDVVLHTRQNSLDGIGNEMAGSDKLQRFMQNQTNFFTKVSGIATWDSMMRTLSSQLEQDALSRMLKKPGGVSAFEQAKLATHGIGADDVEAIRGQWAKYGSNEFGLNRARTELWDDKGAAAKVEQAVQRAGSSNAFFIGKGDLPGFANSEFGKMMIQFKGFALSSVNRLAIPLAQGIAHGDVHAANGLASMLALGGLTYYTKELAAGRKPDLSPARLSSEMVQRSGVLTYIPDLYDPLAGSLNLPRFSKFQNLDPLETIGGPTFGTIGAVLKAMQGATKGNFTDRDLSKLRQLAPYQNLFYFNRLINMVEGKSADALDLKGATGKPALDYLNPAKDQ